MAFRAGGRDARGPSESGPGKNRFYLVFLGLGW